MCVCGLAMVCRMDECYDSKMRHKLQLAFGIAGAKSYEILMRFFRSQGSIRVPPAAPPQGPIDRVVNPELAKLQTMLRSSNPLADLRQSTVPSRIWARYSLLAVALRRRGFCGVGATAALEQQGTAPSPR